MSFVQLFEVPNWSKSANHTNDPKHQQPCPYNQFNPELGQLNHHKQGHNKATKNPNLYPRPLPISATVQENKVNNWIKPAIIEVRKPNKKRKTYRIQAHATGYVGRRAGGDEGVKILEGEDFIKILATT